MLYFLTQKYGMTRKDIENIYNLGKAEAHVVHAVIMEAYNASSEIWTRKYLKDTFFEAEIIDTIYGKANPVGVHTDILHDPYRLVVEFPEPSLLLREYSKTKFSEHLGYDTAPRWMFYTSIAVRALRRQGAEKIPQPVVAVFEYHFQHEESDEDAVTRKFILDAFRLGGLLVTNSCMDLLMHIQGVTDIGGLRLTLLSKADYIKNINSILARSR